MADEVEEIKSRLGIVDFIGQYLQLKKAGRNFKALCPFHVEKTPSFMVSPEKQIWHCFGCQKGGDIFGFLMEYEGIEFVDALKELAEKAGIKLKPQNPEMKDLKDELYQINSMALKFFHYILTKKPTGKAILEYLTKKRGLKLETIIDFQIGYAADSWDLLSRFLKKRGFSDSLILKSGLVIPKEDGTFYDRFRNRIMFPISDIAKNVLGFSGRFFEKSNIKTAGRDLEPAKYINSPDTPIYNKSRILFALDKAKDTIRKTKEVILVEGQMDVIACHQAGFKNTLATSGTALTFEQLKILKRFAKKISFSFDTDTAGQEATKRAIALAHQAEVTPKIILMPTGEDPADVIKENPQIFTKAVKDAQTALDFYLGQTLEKYKNKELTSEDKEEITEELLPVVKAIAKPVLVGDYLKKIATAINLEERYLYDAFKRSKKAFSDFQTPSPEIRKTNFTSLQAENLIEERLLGLILKYPQESKEIFKQIKTSDFEGKINQKIAQAVFLAYTKNGKILPDKIQQYLTPEEQKIANRYYLQVEDEFADASSKLLKDEIIITLARFKSQKLEKIKREFQIKIATAEKRGDRKDIKNLILELQKSIGEKYAK